MKKQARLSDQRGFSTIEMIMVACIVGILGVISLSLMPMIDGMRFKNEAIKFRGALVQARNWAMTKGKCVRVDIDPVARTLSINSFPLPLSLNCDAPTGIAQTVSVVTFEKFVQLGDVGSGSRSIVFSHRGATTLQNVAEFSISHIASQAKMIFAIMPLTGKVSSK